MARRKTAAKNKVVPVEVVDEAVETEETSEPVETEVVDEAVETEETSEPVETEVVDVAVAGVTLALVTFMNVYVVEMAGNKEHTPEEIAGYQKAFAGRMILHFSKPSPEEAAANIRYIAALFEKYRDDCFSDSMCLRHIPLVTWNRREDLRDFQYLVGRFNATNNPNTRLTIINKMDWSGINDQLSVPNGETIASNLRKAYGK